MKDTVLQTGFILKLIKKQLIRQCHSVDSDVIKSNIDPVFELGVSSEFLAKYNVILGLHLSKFKCILKCIHILSCAYILLKPFMFKAFSYICV